MHCLLDFRILPGFSRYRVNCVGDVISCCETGRKRLGDRWRKRKSKIDQVGRPMITLVSDAGDIKCMSVASAVLMAFVGPKPDGTECCHNNGKPADNRVENLRWGTRLSNAADRLLHGTQTRGETAGRAKLTNESVREIRRLREDGLPFQRIAERFGVTKNNVMTIVAGKTWAHVSQFGSSLTCKGCGKERHPQNAKKCPDYCLECFKCGVKERDERIAELETEVARLRKEVAE